MKREVLKTTSVSMTIGDRDRQIIAEIRDEHGLSTNAAVRYALRKVWVDMATTPAEKSKRRAAVKQWLADMAAGRHAGVWE